MSDRPIQVGDLVQIVRKGTCQCASPTKHIGRTFIVSKIAFRTAECQDCGKKFANLGAFWFGKGWCELFRLKRIPPHSELEGERTEETLREPA